MKFRMKINQGELREGAPLLFTRSILVFHFTFQRNLTPNMENSASDLNTGNAYHSQIANIPINTYTYAYQLTISQTPTIHIYFFQK